MILRTDDDLYDVDQRWLGPPGRELPWHARYGAYGWAVLIYLVLTLAERSLLRLAFGFWMLAYTVMATAFLTGRLMRHVTPERRPSHVLAGWWQELRSPRPGTRGRAGRNSTRGGRTRLVLVRSRAVLLQPERSDLQ